MKKVIIFVILLCGCGSGHSHYDSRTPRQKQLDADRQALQQAAKDIQKRGY